MSEEDPSNGRNQEVIGLLDGVRDGRYIVRGYMSEWMKKPANHRKMTIIIEDTNIVDMRRGK